MFRYVLCAWQCRCLKRPEGLDPLIWEVWVIACWKLNWSPQCEFLSHLPSIMHDNAHFLVLSLGWFLTRHPRLAQCSSFLIWYLTQFAKFVIQGLHFLFLDVISSACLVLNLGLPFVSWRALWFTCCFWHFCLLFSRVCFCSGLIPTGAGLRCLFLMCSLFFDCELMLFGTLSENSLRPGWKSHSSRDDVCLLLPEVWRHYKPRFT